MQILGELFDMEVSVTEMDVMASKGNYLICWENILFVLPFYDMECEISYQADDDVINDMHLYGVVCDTVNRH
jgi:hypothetical protein